MNTHSMRPERHENIVTMLRRSVIALVALFAVQTMSGNEPFSHEVIRAIEIPKDKTFDSALLWLASTGRSTKEVVEFKDKEVGTIIGNSTVEIIIKGPMVSLPGELKFKLKIDIKEKRYRLTFSQVILVTGPGRDMPIEKSNRAFVEPLAIEKFNELAWALHTYLGKTASEKAW